MSHHQIAIIGAGALGSALGAMLTDAGQPFTQWDVAAEKLTKPTTVDEAVAGASVIFLCIPTNATREAAAMILPHLQPDAVVVSLSKGMEAESGKLIDELLDEVFPGHRTALVSGPMLASELRAGKVGAAVVAAVDSTTADRVVDALAGTSLILERSTDRRGVALCGVLKNIYAMGLGIAHGLAWGENANGWLVAHSLGEMEQIVGELGGQPDTLFTVAGVGDFVTTALSETSRNHRYGWLLAQGEQPNFEAEGAIALPKLTARIGAIHSFPLLTAIHSVVLDHADPTETFIILQRR